MNKNLLLFLLFTCLHAFKSDAQSNMAALTNANSGALPGNSQNTGASGSNIYSPDLFSGSVNVNIPIYNYSVDGVDLNVSLSYNTLGIKVDQVASNVGLGWTLNTGGMITREVHGIEDELSENEIDTLDAASTTHRAIPDQRGLWVDNFDSSIDDYIPRNDMDDEPDIFTAVIGSRTIKFCLRHLDEIATEMTLFTSPKRDIQVDVFFDDFNTLCGFPHFTWLTNRVWRGADNHEGSILRFKITDERGNQFFFERGDYQIRTYQYKTFHRTYDNADYIYDVPITWVLNKVITYTGLCVNYSYSDDNYSYPAYMNQSVLENSGTVGSIGVINEPVGLNFHSKRLTQIVYPNGDIVKFNIDGNKRLDRTGDRGDTCNDALSSITIKNGYNSGIFNTINYKFNYAYFNSYLSGGSEVAYPTNTIPGPTTCLRLKLKSVDKIGTDGVTTERYYSFGYMGDATGEQTLPARLNGQADCYGYYNGKPVQLATGTSTGEYADIYGRLQFINIPQHIFSFFDHSGAFVIYAYGRDQTPDWNYAQASLLKSVVNGSGGSILFSYKDHNLTNPPDFLSTSTAHVNTHYWDFDDVGNVNGGTSYGAPGLGVEVPNNYHPDPDLQYTNANDGVCIDKIICNDGISPDNTTTTNFDFSDGSGGAGGMRFFPGGFFWYPTWFPGIWVDGYGGNLGNSPVERIYQSSFVNPIDLINGANHGYTKARVKTIGYGGESISDRAYTFTNIEPQASGETITDNSTHITTPATNSRIIARYGPFTHTFSRRSFDKGFMGLLKELDEYDMSGDILSQTINSYNEKTYSDEPFAEASSTLSYYALFTARGYSDGDYLPFSNSIVNLVHSITTNFSGDPSLLVRPTIQMEKAYYYDPDDDLSAVGWIDSKGNDIMETYIYSKLQYNQFYNIGASPRICNLKYLGQKKSSINSDVNGSSPALGSNYSPYMTLGSYYYDGLGNLHDYTYTGAIQVVGPMGVLRFNQIYTFLSNAAGYDHMLLAKHFWLYDDKNNVLQTGYNNDQTFSSSIWDTRIGQKIAEVSNAKYADIAYTSFEGNFAPAGTSDYSKGNWDFNSASIILGSPSDMPITGRYYYNLTGGDLVSAFNPINLGKDYIISFWFKGARPTTAPVIALTNQITVGAWTLATGIISGDGYTHISLSSYSYSCIDELRLFPTDAIMDTYTYEPLIGVSSHCDERNNITYYQYDAMGRPTITTDINGNIISLTKHVIQGSDY